MAQSGYLRHPTLRDDTVVFICDDDLWRVDAKGGIARRLTAGLGEPSTPALSPDGKWIAFVGRDEAHPEVYLMSAEGGIPELMPLRQVNHLAFGPGNAMVIGRNTADPARWKRYRGGTAGYLWIDAAGNGEFRRMRELAGNITSPMWIGERIYYLSDAEGVGNLYSCRPDGSDGRRHTDHDEFYARHAQTDGRHVVYQCGADIWLFDPARDATVKLSIDVPSHRTQAARKFVDAAENLAGFEVHPRGHSLAVEARGKLFTFALWEGAVRQRGIADGVRY